MLTAQQLTLWRGHRCLFADLEFAVESGEVGVVRGPNGSGKTTLLRVLAGLTRPESGIVLWRGQNIERDRIDYCGHIAYLGHTTGLKADLTAAQNLDFATGIGGHVDSRHGEICAALKLDDVRNLPVRYLSAGQQRRVALARTLSSPAPLWLMDEPLTNLDADGQGYVAAAIASHLAGGGAAVVATHSELAVAPEACLTIELGDRQ